MIPSPCRAPLNVLCQSCRNVRFLAFRSRNEYSHAWRKASFASRTFAFLPQRNPFVCFKMLSLRLWETGPRFILAMLLIQKFLDCFCVCWNQRNPFAQVSAFFVRAFGKIVVLACRSAQNLPCSGYSETLRNRFSGFLLCHVIA